MGGEWNFIHSPPVLRFSRSNHRLFSCPEVDKPNGMLDCRHYKEGAWFSLETEPCTFFIFCAFFVVRAVSYLSG